MNCFIDSQIFAIFVTQCSVTVSTGRIKRESGVNPGQSRCCKLHNVPDFIATVLTETGRLTGYGSKSEDLHCAQFQKLRGKATETYEPIISLLQIPRCLLKCDLCKF